MSNDSAETAIPAALELILAELRVAINESPAVAEIVSELVGLLREVKLDPRDTTLSQFFRFACKNPRSAMFLASLGVFLRRDDDRICDCDSSDTPA